jgi:hypothetical protein
MVKALAVVVVPDQDLTSGNLYVDVNGREQLVQDLHPDDEAYTRLDPQVILRQHPGAYYRLRVKPEEVWRPTGRRPQSLGFDPPASKETSRLEAENARKSLDAFLGTRLPELSAPDGSPAAEPLTTWGWVTVIAAALNAVGLFFFPIANSDTLATLSALGAQPTGLTRLVAGWWFSPLLGVLTAACLVQAFRNPSRRKFWIRSSYVPALVGLAAAVIGSYSAYISVLDNIK